MHTDAAQSLGKVRVDMGALGVDMATVVGHKFGAPKGVAALFVRWLAGWLAGRALNKAKKRQAEIPAGRKSLACRKRSQLAGRDPSWQEEILAGRKRSQLAGRDPSWQEEIPAGRKRS